MGFAGLLQNGSHILLPLHRRLAILFCGETELKWRSGLRGDSRMWDLFCDGPAILDNAAITLVVPLIDFFSRKMAASF